MTSTKLIGFGSNYYCALGGALPTRLSHDDDCNDVAAVASNPTDYVQHKNNNDAVVSIACTTTATIFVTGQGKIHQVGTMHGQIYKTPTPITVELPLKVMTVAAGRHFCVGLMEGGLAAVSWGAGHFGQLGHGPNICSLRKPRVMEHLLPHNTGGSPLVQVAVGSWHGLALTKAGKIYAWGSNRRWQCGIKRTNGNSSSSKENSTPPTLVYPQPIPMTDNNAVFDKICCGKSHSVALCKGRVYTWGASHAGQCGHHTRRSTIAPPRLVEALARVVVVDVAAGDSHTLAVTGGGRVFSWGSGLEGQLGLGPSVPLSRPKLVDDLDFVAICAGQEWKKNQQLQQQTESAADSRFLKPFMYNPSPLQLDRPVVDPYAVKNDSDTNNDECKGTALMLPSLCGVDGVLNSSSKPSVHQLSKVPKICSVEAAGSYSAAISTSGHVYTWGYNDVGVLGLPKPRDASAVLPLVEPLTSSMAAAAAAASNTNGNAPLSLPTSSGSRLLEVQTFDSRHNVLLPRRVDALADYNVKQIAGGPSHMWCLCEPRQGDNNDTSQVGLTLYEVQEERRIRGMRRMKQNLVGTLPAYDDDEQAGSGKEVASSNKNTVVDSEEEDDNDDTEDTTAEQDRNGLDNKDAFVKAAQAAPPKKDASKSRRIARFMHKLSGSSSKNYSDSAGKKKSKARKQLSLLFCKSER